VTGRPFCSFEGGGGRLWAQKVAGDYSKRSEKKAERKRGKNRTPRTNYEKRGGFSSTRKRATLRSSLKNESQKRGSGEENLKVNMASNHKLKQRKEDRTKGKRAIDVPRYTKQKGGGGESQKNLKYVSKVQEGEQEEKNQRGSTTSKQRG